MATPRLFIEQELGTDRRIVLRGESARYAGRVLRCRPGDELILFNGSGGEYPAIVDAVRKQELTVQTGAQILRDVESPLAVHLLQGVSRGERMDVVVQKATELGVRRITPVLMEFSVVRLDEERAHKRQQHWQRIAWSACEQSGRNSPPVVDLPCTFSQALECAKGNNGVRLLLQPGSEHGFAALPAAAASIALLIGPEGGLSPAEQEQALADGFTAVACGPRVLRTETAAIAALALVQARWGDLG